ncbi:nuclear transport factor 2 family protein [Streptomyces sp. NPDC002143]
MAKTARTPLETVRTYYHLIDIGELDAAFALFAEDARVRFGDQPELSGRNAAAEKVSGMLVPIAKSVEHAITRAYEVADRDSTTVICEAVVTYVMLRSGNVIPHNAVTISEVDSEGHIIRQRNVGDLRPVIADHLAHAEDTVSPS